MHTECPSCSKAVDADATAISVDGVSAVTRCNHCGFTLAESAPPVAAVRHADHPNSSAAERRSAVDARDPGPTVTPFQSAAEDPGPTYTPFAPHPDATIIGQSPQDEGSRVAHFELVRVLGQGGFGAVWLARDMNLNRDVALKLPKDPDVRLLHEAQTAARLRHPNIVAVYEVGVENDRAYIASEYIDGETLKDELQRGRPTIERAVQVMISIAHAADHAHTQEVVHRDMKPANVMVDRQGKPFITDFGIAKSVSEDETISLDGEIVGTIAYMAPEQASGQNSATDRRADVYAMGVMLFELLTEYRPFRGSAQGILFQKGNEDAPSPCTLVPSLPKDLETICLKCLEREPEKRYQSARELADELTRFKDHIPIYARPISRLEKVWRWCLRNRTVALGSVAFVLLLTTFSVIGWYLRTLAVASNERTTETLYRTRMTLLSDAWGTGNVDLVVNLLREYEGAEYERLRDFAWYYHEHARAPFGLSVNHGNRVSDLALSRDGSLLATLGTKDKVLRVWDAKKGTLLRHIKTDGFQSLMVNFSPADDRLLTADDDGKLRIWSPAEHDHVAFELDHGAGLTCGRISPDRRIVASADINGSVKLWSLSDRELLHEISDPGKPILDLRFSGDSSQIAIIMTRGSRPAAMAQCFVRIIDSKSGETEVDSVDRRRLTRVEFSGNNSEVVAIAESGHIYRFDTVSGEEIEVLPPRSGSGIGDVVRIGSSTQMAVCNSNGELLFLNELLKETHKLWTHISSFGVLDASADGKTVVVGSGDGSVRFISTERLGAPVIGWQDGILRDVEFCDGDRAIAVACADGGVRVWDIEAGAFHTVIPADEAERDMLSVSLNPANQQLAACGMMRHLQTAGIDASTEVVTQPLPAGGHSCLDFSADGSLFAIGSNQGIVSIYRGQLSEHPLMTFSTDARVRDLSFAQHSDLLAATFSDNRLLIAKPEDQSVHEIEIPPDDEPLSVAFCRDDQWLVIGTQQGFLRFFHLTDVTQNFELKAHAGRVNDLVELPDGRRLVTAGDDKVLRIWDMDARDVVTHLQGHHRGVLAVAVSQDGRTLASTSVEGELRIWRTEDR